MSSETSDGLIRLGAHKTTREYLGEVWARRDFLIVVPRNDIRIRNMDTVLGQFWHLLNPALMVAVYYVVFGVILDTRRGTANFFTFLVIGVLLFRFTQRVITESVTTMTRNVGLIRAIEFPRAILPLSTVIGQTIAFIPSLLILLCVLLISGYFPRWEWLVFPVVLIAQAALQTGGSLLAARAGHSVGDLSQLLPHFFRFLLYGSGVLFSVENFVENETIIRLLAINPIYDILGLARWSLMGQSVGPEQVVATIVWCVTLPVVGLVVFKSAEARYGA